MRILIVSQYYTPDITAAAFRMAETAELLSRWGHEVAVVTAEPHRTRVQAAGARDAGEAAGPEVAADAEKRAAGAGRGGGEGSAGPQVKRVAVKPLSGSGLKPYLSHYLSFVRRARRAGKNLIRGGFTPDAVWVSSPPLFVGLVGAPLRRAARRSGGREARFVLDVRDIWPDTAVAAGQISSEGRAYRLGRMLERRLYRQADAMSCVAQPMAEYLRSASGKRVAVVYNGVEARPGSEDAEAAGALSGGAGERGGRSTEARREILYAGNWGRLQGLEVLLSAWAELCDEPFYAAWQLRFVGDGVMAEELKRRAEQLGISGRVRFDPPLSKAEALALMEQAGLLFLNLRPDAVFSYTIPSKLFDYLRAGRPIIGGIPGEGAEILKETGGNITFPPNDAEALIHALRLVPERYEELQRRAPANGTLVAERFSREAATGRLLELFHESRRGRLRLQ